jgi:hypothetical protein
VVVWDLPAGLDVADSNLGAFELEEQEIPTGIQP